MATKKMTKSAAALDGSLFYSMPDRADPTKHKALREAARAEARAQHGSPADWPIWMPGDRPQGAAPTRTVLDVIEHSQAKQRGRLARDARLDAMAQREEEHMGRKLRAGRNREEAAAKISSIVAKHAAAGAAGHIKASTGAVPKKGMATHVTEHVSSKAKAKIAGLAASVGDKHKKVQAKQLPQGYAMVFGKLRKITASKPRTGIAKLKR